MIYENPSPGNKAGGITTLEEKSLGCIQKGGLSPVVDVLSYGDRVRKPGLSLLNGPGNDIVAVTGIKAHNRLAFFICSYRILRLISIVKWFFHSYNWFKNWICKSFSLLK